jgi:hypothetical protein
MDDATGGWPRLSDHIPEIERLRREKMFKQFGFLLLFRLADCTAGMREMPQIRMRQGKFLESLTAVETAILCCLVELVGQGFLNITGRAILPQYLETMRTSMASAQSSPGRQQALGSTTLGIPAHTTVNDHSSENWLRECMCVFEDRMQRYGNHAQQLSIYETPSVLNISNSTKQKC